MNIHSKLTIGALLLSFTFIAGCKKDQSSAAKAPDLGLTKITVFAGSGSAGNADGPATTATFEQIWAIALDAAGNAYTVDSSRIRKITPAGVVSTLQDSPNAAGGTLFADADGIAIDGAGNFYVSYSAAHCIRKISPDGKTGVVFAGMPGVDGYKDGTGTDARFEVPVGLAADAAGNIYVADAGNGSIRKITPAGGVSTLAGNGSFGSADGTGADASFFEPYGVAFDKSGNLFVADAANNKIRKVTLAGVVTTVAGGPSFNSPSGLAVTDDGTIYVCNYGSASVIKISAGGRISLVGSDIFYYGFFGPTDIVSDKTGGLFMVDRGNNQIKKIIPPK
jgi:hypothetical protein